MQPQRWPRLCGRARAWPADSDEWVKMLKGKQQASQQAREVRYSRYEWAPAPPQPWDRLLGHASYELAYREERLYEWLAEQRCDVCHGPTHNANHTAALSAPASRPHQHTAASPNL
eukprot:3042734-Prymnesium_polylepis.1